MDLIVVFAMIEAFPRIGLLGGVFYILVSDGLLGGQSFGKKLTGLRTVRVGGEPPEESVRPCDIKSSLLRNGALGLGILLIKIPLLGWLIFLAIVSLESITLIGSSEGRRLGDEIAGTKVEEVIKESKGRQDIV